MNAMERAKEKFGDVVEVRRGYVNPAYEEYDEAAREYGGEITSILVRTAKTKEVERVLRVFPEARLWGGVWQGHVITPDIAVDNAEKVIRSHQWPQYRFVWGPRRVPFWSDICMKDFGDEPAGEFPKIWVDIISPGVGGDDATAFAFVSVFDDGTELHHSYHVERHKFLGVDGNYAYFCQMSDHEAVPQNVEVVARVGDWQWQTPTKEIGKRRKQLCPVFRVPVPAPVAAV